MAAVTTSGSVETGLADAPPFSLIEPKGLMARLGEELARAAREFLSDPRAFMRGLFVAETRDAKRRRRIYISLACAFVFHIGLIIVIAVAGWHYVQVNASQTTDELVTWVPINSLDIPEGAKPEKLIGNGGGGGGGGDQNALQPATKGVTPQMSPTPQIVKPLAPTVPEPSLPLPSTIVGPESAPVPANVQLGVMNGAIDAPPSPGRGTGDGIGGGRGSGAGPGDGAGAGPGSGGGRGPGGRAGTSDGVSSVPTPIDFRIAQKPPGFTNFAWIYRPRPIVTPEAQDKKVNGEVLLRATFHADGRITDIEVIRPIDYMTESAVESLRKSKFRPATVNGQPVTLLNVYIKVRVSAGDLQ